MRRMYALALRLPILIRDTLADVRTQGMLRLIPFWTVPRIPPLPQSPWNRFENCGGYDACENRSNIRRSDRLVVLIWYSPPRSGGCFCPDRPGAGATDTVPTGRASDRDGRRQRQRDAGLRTDRERCDHQGQDR